MSLQEKYLKILSRIIPVGAAGVSLLLGSATPSDANLTDAQPPASAPIRISQHLSAIRDAISAIADIEVADIRGPVRAPQGVNNWNKFKNYWNNFCPTLPCK